MVQLRSGSFCPVRAFLNDTYGLFFYDPMDDYVTVFKGLRIRFYGWRNGVMVVKGKDGNFGPRLQAERLMVHSREKGSASAEPAHDMVRTGSCCIRSPPPTISSTANAIPPSICQGDASRSEGKHGAAWIHACSRSRPCTASGLMNGQRRIRSIQPKSAHVQ